ncbi:MAG TPA: hypothetical protein PKD80_05980 [Microthrixaceae bacterium]|nr:hypothetical protein [Microthrixaceae bacterium]HMT25759.1 hypothetical protein [Microthrixaceae bacterium]HMT61805.1 hypothetical protein [Microthrixaceae bacterium]
MTVGRVRVGDVLALQRREVAVEPDEFYTLIGVYSFGKGIFHRDPKPGSELGGYRFFSVVPGDLVLSNIQAWEGAIAYATESDRGAIGTHRFLSYVPRDGRIDTNWARWFFLSEPGMDLIRMAAPGTTIRNRTLAIERFEALEIPLPPIDEQRRQAFRLDLTSDVSRAAAQSLEQTAPGMLRRLVPAFVDGLLSSAAVGSAAVSDVANFVSDTVHIGDDPTPADCFVGLQHVESHTGRVLGSDSLEGLKGRKFRFQPGDVVFGYLRPYLNKVWLADRHGLCSVDQYVLRPKPGVDGRILAHSLRGQATLDRAVELTHSLQLPRLRSGLLAGLHVRVVPAEAVDSIVLQIEAAVELMISVSTLRERQTALVGALLPAALNSAFGAVS